MMVVCFLFFSPSLKVYKYHIERYVWHSMLIFTENGPNNVKEKVTRRFFRGDGDAFGWNGDDADVQSLIDKDTLYYIQLHACCNSNEMMMAVTLLRQKNNGKRHWSEKRYGVNHWKPFMVYRIIKKSTETGIAYWQYTLIILQHIYTHTLFLIRFWLNNESKNDYKDSRVF